MHSHILLNRLRKELADLEKDPPPGIVCYSVDDDITHLESYIKGPPDSPYEKGMFKLDIKVPQSYPFDPPQIYFKTRIYHPNIDEAGRICADILKKGEHGGWRPSLNLSTTLISLRSLMAHPNPDDPLDADIAREYQLNYELFVSKANDYTLQYATGESSSTTGQSQDNTQLDKQKAATSVLDDELPNISTSSQPEPLSQTKSRLSLSTKKRKANSSAVSSQKRHRENDSVDITTQSSRASSSSIIPSASKHETHSESKDSQQSSAIPSTLHHTSSSPLLASSKRTQLSSNESVKSIDIDTNNKQHQANATGSSGSASQKVFISSAGSKGDSNENSTYTKEIDDLSATPTKADTESPTKAEQISADPLSQTTGAKSFQSSKNEAAEMISILSPMETDDVASTPAKVDTRLLTEAKQIIAEPVTITTSAKSLQNTKDVIPVRSQDDAKTTNEVPIQDFGPQKEQSQTSLDKNSSSSTDNTKDPKSPLQIGIDISQQDDRSADFAAMITSSQERWSTVLQEVHQSPIASDSGNPTAQPKKKPRPKLSLSKSKKQKA